MVFRISGELKHSFVNGPGVRYVVFFQGCKHNCPGCHNPDSHNLSGGPLVDTADVLGRIAKTKFLDGITLSGGDPLLQPEACIDLAANAKDMGLSVWLYTGWTYEEVLASKHGHGILQSIDVLVDGPYIEARQSKDCLWRGSSNQRLIDVPHSFEAGTVVLWDENRVLT